MSDTTVIDSASPEHLYLDISSDCLEQLELLAKTSGRSIGEEAADCIRLWLTAMGELTERESWLAVLKHRACANGRSLREEGEHGLKQWLFPVQMTSKELLPRIDQARAARRTAFVTQQQLETMKGHGRL